MNRLSKFRAFDSLRKVMIATGYHVIGEVTMFGIIDQYISEHLEGKSHLERYNDIIESQFMEHKDKNNKDVYEGDILISDWGYTGEVIFDSFIYAKSECTISDNIEVIGNIFENPELI